MRVSSAMRSPSSGTLKSTRTSARLPRISEGSRSAIVLLLIGEAVPPSEPRADVLQEIDAARGVAPLIVVPARDLHHRTVDHIRVLRVEDARVRIADVVARDERLLGVLQDTFERTVARGPEGGVHVGNGRGLLDLDGELGERDIRGRHSDGDA